MFKWIAKWILKMVDFEVTLEDSKVTVVIKLGGTTVFKKTFDFADLSTKDNAITLNHKGG